MLTVVPTTGPQEPDTERLVHELRSCGYRCIPMRICASFVGSRSLAVG